ncbi:SGNH/GDSL hydrolase family protein [Rhizobium leguminosarum]
MALSPSQIAALVGAGVISSGGGGPSNVGLFNFKTSQFTKTKAMKSRVLAGTGRGRICVPGDSTAWGEGGGDSGSNNRVNAKLRAWPTILAQRLSSLGLSANWEGIYGSGGVAVATVPIATHRSLYYAGMNARAAWDVAAAARLGGVWFQNSTDGGILSYTSTIPVNRFEIADITASGGGVISYNIDGGAETQLTQTNATASFRLTTVDAGAPGIHTINITRVSGTGFFVGIRAWNEAVPQVDVLNFGMGSSVVADWVVNTVAYSPLPSLATMCASADLVILPFTINDAIVPTSTASYKASLQTLINTAKAGGADVLLQTGNPCSLSADADVNQQGIRQAMKDLALSNDLPMIDLFDLYGDYLSMVARNLMYNSRHPNTAGYADIGNFVADTIWRFAA